MARRPPRSARPSGRAARPATPARPAPRKKAPAKATATRETKAGPRAPKKASAPAGTRAKAAATRKPAATGAARPAAPKKTTRAAAKAVAKAARPKARALPQAPAARPKAKKAAPAPPVPVPVPAPAPIPPAPPAVRASARRLPPVRTRPTAPRYVDLEPEEDEHGDVLVPGAVSSLDMDHQPRELRRTGVDPEPPLRGRHLDDAHLVAGDVDADLEAASHVGEETPGGDNPTPDQDVVDLIGRSLGVEYEDDEELEGGAEITKRDRKRWELDPASSEDWKERSKG